ncbi:MAG: glycine cleavage system aminomethyltransferase GcvT [Longimicrobiales bacterium]|nr:glycine cleavage system aminomethyltransferase GcvT [Longimicrobiales bacterium]
MNDTLRHTPLHDRHLRHNGKMVPFAGYSMPVQYPTGIRAEHAAVRATAGLFDVSHMGEFAVRGPDALALIQKVTINDASKVAVGQAQYSAMVNEDGFVLDDLILYRYDAAWMMVVNAANRAKDWAWVTRHAEGLDVELHDTSDEIALLALQGPKAREILRPLVSVDLDAIGYYRFAEGEVAGVAGTISATGYTGEDGFELYVPAPGAGEIWDALLEAGAPHGLMLAGLGARDSLRLEVGYALYGNDLDEEHTPLESALGWITKLDKGEFVGRDALVAQKERGVERRLVGMRLTERGIPRPGYPIRVEGEPRGVVTSGTMSPSLGVGIALGYLPVSHASGGSEVAIEIRDSAIPAVVQRPPFYTEGSIRR